VESTQEVPTAESPATEPAAETNSAADAEAKKTPPAAKDAKPAKPKSTAKAKPTAKGTATAAAPPTRTPQQIQSDIDAAQQRLADQVDALSERLQPQALAGDALSTVKRVFLDENGSPKTKPIAIAVGSITALLVLRKLFHRS
jgi:hypothetical protein